MSRRLASALRATRAWAAVVASAAAPLACRSVTDPPLPGGAVRFTPPAVYARWWAMTEACSGTRRDMGEVTWYVVPGAETFSSPSGGGDANGYYSRPGSQVVLAGASQLDGAVVRHEMLHAMLRSESGHPRRAFLEQCGGVVRCEQPCVRDAGPAPAAPAGTRALPAEFLVLGAELAPAGAGTPGEDAWYTFTVTATNPASYPVEATLAPVANAPNYGYVITPDPPRAPEPGVFTGYVRQENTFDPSVVRFAAGETRRHVYDVHVMRDPLAGLDGGRGPGDLRLAPGAYRFRARFGDSGRRDSDPVVTATLAP